MTRFCSICAAIFLVLSICLSAEDQLLLMDVPVYYGEENFRERLKDLPSGRETPLGLLLSGGSARAFSHIGVLKRLEEEGLPPDFIVTNSMGSIVGLLYGAGISPDDILMLIKSIELAKLFDPVVPLKGGLLSTDLFTSLLREILPYDDISKFPIPVLVVCDDLRTKRRIVFAEGEVGTLFAASFALPFYFPPQELNGHLLIDGGISNTVPVSIMYRFSDKIIVSTSFYQKEQKLDNPLTILNVAIDIPKTRSGVAELKQYNPLWIRSDVETFSFMDWAAIDKIVEQGYLSTDRFLQDYGISENAEELEFVDIAYMEDIREPLRGHAYGAIDVYNRSGTVHVSPAVAGMKMGFALEDDLMSRSIFGDRNRIYGGLYFKGGFASLDLRTFIQPEIMNQYHHLGTTFSGFSLQAQWLAFRRFRIRGSGEVNFVGSDSFYNELSFASSHFAAELDFPLDIGERLRLGPSARIEAVTDNSFEIDRHTEFGGVRLRYPGKVSLFSFDTEAGLYRDNQEREAFQAVFSSNLRFGSTLSWEQRFMGRVPFGDTENVPYYPADFFRLLSNPEIHERLFISNTSLMLGVYRWLPTFGEVLILDNLSFGLFMDYRNTGAGSDDYAFGGILKTGLSLIGLKPLNLQLHAGWLPAEDTWKVAFFFNS